MTRPRGGDWLTDELRDLAVAGLDVLVSLLSAAEVAELDLGAEADAPGQPESSSARCRHRTVRSPIAPPCWRSAACCLRN